MKKLTSKIAVLSLFGILGGVVAFAFAKPVIAAEPGQVLITEFMADPSQVTDSRGEWVEIKNISHEEIDLTGWDIDGSTISGNLVMPSQSSAVICRNLDTAQNGGVVCNASSGFSLTNSGDTINLRDQNNQVVDTVIYSSEQVSAGHSTELKDSDLVVNQTHQYGDGDFGTPANNPFGGVLVHSVLEKNGNKHPDLLGGEQYSSDWQVNLYKVTDSGWEYRNNTTTTGMNWPNSAGFATSPGEYAACLVVPDNHYETFAKQVSGWFSYSNTETENLSDAEIINDPLCSLVTVEADQISQHIFGARKKFAENSILRIHVLNDLNGNGQVDYGQEGELLAGWEVRLYKLQDWQNGLSLDPQSATVTTGLSYGDSASFTLDDSTPNWIVCLEQQLGFSQTFERIITSYVSTKDAGTQNLSNTSDEGEKCIEVSIKNGELQSLLFGVSAG